MIKSTYNRRSFIKNSSLATGGLVVGFFISSGFKGAKKLKPKSPVTYHTPNAFIQIGTDDSINIVVNHAEMGQGIYTSLCQIVADELEADWSKVNALHAPMAPAYDHLFFPGQMTGGSTSVYTEWSRLRKVAAATRQMLINAAAQRWNVSSDQLIAENGTVRYGVQRLSYGQLAEAAAKLDMPEDVPLKNRKDFKFIGKPVHRLDTPIKVNGEAKFGLDVALPDMLVAVVAHPPFKAKVISFDDRKARAIEGVLDVIEIPTGVAVIADGFWSAKKGRDALEVNWDTSQSKHITSAKTLNKYKKLIKNAEGAKVEQEGNVQKAFSEAKSILDVTYQLPYLAHAPMEPLNCVADVKDNTCTIYIGTQGQTIEGLNIAHATGIPFENITVNLQYLGGGFGRRVTVDAHISVEAALISQKIKKPVKLIWTREDDIQGGYYRSPTLTRVKGAIDQDGHLSALEAKMVSESIMKRTPLESMFVKDGVDSFSVEGMAESPYHIPNVNIDWVDAETLEVPVLWWRSVGHSLNGFIMESFIDEIAEQADQDPYEFRKILLKNHPRNLDALNLAVSKSAWGKTISSGHALGLAVHESFGSSVAYVLEVSIQDDWPVVHQVWAAIDCGPYVNPDTIKAQIEGSIIFGLTAALYGEITIDEGVVKQSNFHDYKMIRMHQSPKIEVHIVESDKKMGGVGEPGVPPIAPALVNALYKLTGKRIHKMPITKADCKIKSI